MDFNFTNEQSMMRDNVARYLQKNYDFDQRRKIVASGCGLSRRVWSHFAELGLLALPFPEAAGGLGGSIVDVVSMAELFGQYLVIEPYCASMLPAGNAIAAVARANPSGIANALLAQVMASEKLIAFAHEEGKGIADPSRLGLKATRSGDGYRLDGEKRYVLGGMQADKLVVSVRTDGVPGDVHGLALMLVDPRHTGLTIKPFETVDGRAAGHASFDGAEISSEALLMADAGAAINEVIQVATIALCAEAVGAMGALLAKTAEYASTRKQFGAPIGSFQAVAHRLADMKIAYASARATLLYTSALAEAGRATRRDISILKGQTGVLGIAIGEAAVQTYGGVGMTDELTIGHYLKRLLAIDAMFGNSEYHFRILGKAEPASAIAP